MSTTQSFIKGLAAAGVVATVFAAASSPAQAVSIGSSLTFSGNAVFSLDKIDFRSLSNPSNANAASRFVVTSGTSSLASLNPVEDDDEMKFTTGFIKDISLNSPFSSISKFLDLKGDEYDFDLTELTAAGTNKFLFKGVFTKTNTLGVGELVRLSEIGGSNAFGYTASVTAVPTPALLPGLIGMGVAALRKRQGNSKDSAEA